MTELCIAVRSRVAEVNVRSRKVDIQGRPERVIVAVEQGPKGPVGPPGPSFDGTAWWYGIGAPGTVLGSKPGDYYVDTDTGVVYRLGD